MEFESQFRTEDACWDYLVGRVPDYAIYQERAKEHRVLCPDARREPAKLRSES
jgi:hypothetical protein